MTQSKHKKQMTPAALAANQANAQRSTGPRTTEGKERSRLNALEHGAYSIIANPVLPSESMEQYQRFTQSVVDMYQTHNVMQVFFIESLAAEMWCFARLNRQECNAIVYTPDPGLQNKEITSVTLLKQRKLNIILKILKEHRTGEDRGKAARAEAGLPDTYDDLITAFESVEGDACILPVTEADEIEGGIVNKYPNVNPNITSGAYNKLNDLNLSKINKPNATMQDIVQHRIAGIPLGHPPDINDLLNQRPKKNC